jgi:hypothetical protein
MSIAKIKEFIGDRKNAYELTFEGIHGEAVLRDLAKFCRATQSTFHKDERIHATLEGRREVFLRIMDHLKLTQDDLYKLYR